MADIADIAQEFIEFEEALRLQQRSKAETRPSSTECQECGNDIPEARQLAIPGVQLCVACQDVNERRKKHCR